VWQCSWRGCERFGARCGILVPTLGSRTALSERRMKNKDVSVVPAWKGLLWYARMSADKRALGMGGGRVICCRTEIWGRPRIFYGTVAPRIQENWREKGNEK
jgi:hypothetical protein